MTDAIVQEIILELNEEFEWLGPCIQRFEVTSVGNTYNLNKLFSKDDKVPKQKKTNRICITSEFREIEVSELF